MIRQTAGFLRSLLPKPRPRCPKCGDRRPTQYAGLHDWTNHAGDDDTRRAA